MRKHHSVRSLLGNGRVRAAAGGLAAVAVALPFAGGLAATPTFAPTASAAQLNRLETVMKSPGILARSKLVGQVSASTEITGAVGLKPRNDKALQQFISSVTTKGSPEFHRYLSKGQFAKEFGPAPSTIASVRSALQHDGLRVGTASSNGLLVTFSGTAGRIESAFHTGLADYRLPNGSMGRATTSAVQLPASIAGSVNVVTGLDDLVHASSAGVLRATKAEAASHQAAKAATVPDVSGAPHACEQAAQAAEEYGGLTDDQIANAYGAFGLYKNGDTGSGQTIAVYELEPFLSSDINSFDQCYFGDSGASQMANRLHVVPVDGGQPAGPGSGEALLDIEDVSAMAPGATIDVYEAPNTTFGGLDEYNQIVSSDAANVVTSSWGLCEQAVQQGEPGVQQEENAIFQEAAAQGQTVFSAAGDTGEDDCNAFRLPEPVAPYVSVDDPGSQPYVVSVGGTTIDDATQPPSEHVWNDGALWGAGGGGISSSWTMPSWQYSSQVPGIEQASAVYQAAFDFEGDSFCDGNSTSLNYDANYTGAPCREVPDVTAQADEFTGAITVYSAPYGGWFTIGGTSSATPIWAGLLADVNASPTCQSDGETSGVGFVSPLLYGVASNPTAYAASFNDITVGNNDIYDVTNGLVFPATKGYDMASGLGSPQLTSPSGGDGLAYYLCSYGASATRPSVTGLDPAILAAFVGNSDASDQTVTVTGTGFEDQSGTAQVSSVWVDNILIPIDGVSIDSEEASFTVDSATQLTLDLPAGFFNTVYPSPVGLGTPGVSDGEGPAAVVVTIDDGETSAVTPASVLDIVDENNSSEPIPAVTGVSSYGGPESGANTVTILGSGFSASDTVTFGGVSSPSVTYSSAHPYELTAVVPAYESGTTACATDLNATDDVCQVQVQVTNANGSSFEYQISQPYEGAYEYNSNGVITPPPSCGCEVAPAASEYDYFPVPTISSLSTVSGDPYTYGSELGTSTLTIEGSGFDSFSLSNLTVGPPGEEGSQDLNFSYVSATEIQVALPPIAITLDATSLPVEVQTLGGTSNSEPAYYAGIPEVSSVSPKAVPDTGGSAVTVLGAGMTDVIGVELADTDNPYSIGTVYSFSTPSDDELTFTSPQQNPGVMDVLACTVTSCSYNPPNDELTLYPPGNPSVTRSSPRSGPAHGGARVTISGTNLGCVTAVYFGTAPAKSFANAPQILDCGSTTTVVAFAPPGKAGRTVSITLETVESQATGYGRSQTVKAATFTYKASSPDAPVIHVRAGVDRSTESWAAPTDDGGSPVTFYVVRAIAKGLPERVKVLPASARSFTFTGLYWGTTWKLTVCAHNKYGAGLVASAITHPRRPTH
jgi:hypothetical protein